MDETAVQSKMQNVVNNLVNDISTIRTGRATSALVEGIEVIVYGGQQN